MHSFEDLQRAFTEIHMLKDFGPQGMSYFATPAALGILERTSQVRNYDGFYVSELDRLRDPRLVEKAVTVVEPVPVEVYVLATHEDVEHSRPSSRRLSAIDIRDLKKCGVNLKERICADTPVPTRNGDVI